MDHDLFISVQNGQLALGQYSVFHYQKFNETFIMILFVSPSKITVMYYWSNILLVSHG